MPGSRKGIAKGKGPISQILERSNPAVCPSNNRGVIIGRTSALRFEDHLDLRLILGEDIGGGGEKSNIQFVSSQRLHHAGVVRGHERLDFDLELPLQDVHNRLGVLRDLLDIF